MGSIADHVLFWVRCRKVSNEGIGSQMVEGTFFALELQPWS